MMPEAAAGQQCRHPEKRSHQQLETYRQRWVGGELQVDRDDTQDE